LKHARSEGVTVHTHLIRPEGKWLYVPAYVQNGDVIEQAHLLQTLEDYWNDQEETQETKLLLVPAAA